MCECARCHQTSRIHGRRLCQPCHRAETRNGTIDTWTPTGRPTWNPLELMAAWDNYSAAGYTTTQAAAELGMTADGLRSAISRHHKPEPGPSTEWVQRAACAGSDPEVWFPPDSTEEDHAHALRRDYCGHCPVQTQCLDEALRSGVVGVWAATTTKQRADMRRRTTRQRTG